jgi:hypothetical protein
MKEFGVRNGRMLALVVGLTVVLALPAASDGAAFNLSTRRAVKTPNKGFRLSLNASQGFKGEGFSSPANVSFLLFRGSENDYYSFTKHIKFTAKRNMSRANIKGSFAKHRGKIAMKFKATSKKQTEKVPKGCTGKPGAQRHGILVGKLRLKADRLGTVRGVRLKTNLSKPATIVDCTGNGGGGPKHATELDATQGNGGEGQGNNVSVSAFKPDKGRVIVTVSKERDGNGFSFSNSLQISTSRSAYKFASNLSKANVKGPGKGLKGKAHYSGTAATEGEGGSFSSGKLGGSLVAKLRSLGKVRPFRKGKLDASQQSF